jgi:hypothetical protein
MTAGDLTANDCRLNGINGIGSDTGLNGIGTRVKKSGSGI